MSAKTARVVAAFGMLAIGAMLARAQAPGKIYAQKLVDDVVASHPDVLVFAMHVTAPGAADNTIIAANVPAIIGKKSDADDLKAVASAQPVSEVAKDKARFEVLMQLKDRQGKTIGALATVFAYRPGDDQARLVRRAVLLRNQLRKSIPSLASLFKVSNE
ncbi:MAG TPA: hypothetical protein VGS20_07235 [Candidatus Acidoferrales bacterium]|nr:hypothetical protein [Candidatus Acidoferrales bacterium]